MEATVIVDDPLPPSTKNDSPMPQRQSTKKYISDLVKKVLALDKPIQSFDLANGDTVIRVGHLEVTGSAACKDCPVCRIRTENKLRKEQRKRQRQQAMLEKQALGITKPVVIIPEETTLVMLDITVDEMTEDMGFYNDEGKIPLLKENITKNSKGKSQIWPGEGYPVFQFRSRRSREKAKKKKAKHQKQTEHTFKQKERETPSVVTQTSSTTDGVNQLQSSHVATHQQQASPILADSQTLEPQGPLHAMADMEQQMAAAVVTTPQPDSQGPQSTPNGNQQQQANPVMTGPQIRSQTLKSQDLSKSILTQVGQRKCAAVVTGAGTQTAKLQAPPQSTPTGTDPQELVTVVSSTCPGPHVGKSHRPPQSRAIRTEQQKCATVVTGIKKFEVEVKTEMPDIKPKIEKDVKVKLEDLGTAGKSVFKTEFDCKLKIEKVEFGTGILETLDAEADNPLSDSFPNKPTPKVLPISAAAQRKLDRLETRAESKGRTVQEMFGDLTTQELLLLSDDEMEDVEIRFDKDKNPTSKQRPPAPQAPPSVPVKINMSDSEAEDDSNDSDSDIEILCEYTRANPPDPIRKKPRESPPATAEKRQMSTTTITVETSKETKAGKVPLNKTSASTGFRVPEMRPALSVPPAKRAKIERHSAASISTFQRRPEVPPPRPTHPLPASKRAATQQSAPPSHQKQPNVPHPRPAPVVNSQPPPTRARVEQEPGSSISRGQLPIHLPKITITLVELQPDGTFRSQ